MIKRYIMELNNLKQVIDDNAEFDIHNKLTNESFLKILEEYDINLDFICSKRKKHNLKEFHEFNFLLKNLHEHEKLNIVDCCLCIEENYLKIQDVIKCLNEENAYLLRLSLAERNNIKINKNLLDLYMY